MNAQLHNIAAPRIRQYLETRNYEAPPLEVIGAIIDCCADGRWFVSIEEHDSKVNEIEMDAGAEAEREGYDLGYADALADLRELSRDAEAEASQPGPTAA